MAQLHKSFIMKYLFWKEITKVLPRKFGAIWHSIHVQVAIYITVATLHTMLHE